MKVEIGAKTAARTIKILLSALKVADNELDHLATEHEHMERIIEDLGEMHREYVKLAERKHQCILLASAGQGGVDDPKSAPVTQSPSKPCPMCGAMPWGKNPDCHICAVVRRGL